MHSTRKHVVEKKHLGRSLVECTIYVSLAYSARIPVVEIRLWIGAVKKKNANSTLRAQNNYLFMYEMKIKMNTILSCRSEQWSGDVCPPVSFFVKRFPDVFGPEAVFHRAPERLKSERKPPGEINTMVFKISRPSAMRVQVHYSIPEQ